MSKVLYSFSVLCALFCLCSCGNLTRTQLGGPQLSKADMDFARNMVYEPNWSRMHMEFNQESNYTDKWCSYLIPAFPVMYWTTFGSFNEEKCYGVRKVATFVPLFYVVRDGRYDSAGKRIESDFEFNLAMAIWFERVNRDNSDNWRTGLLWLPGLGPFLGFGSDFFQFLWIPFSDL